MAEHIKLTYQEAIEILESNRPTSGYTMLNAAIDMAKEMLSKQTPKKPDYEGDGYSDGNMVYDVWICPSCGEKYEVDYDDYKYCPECGQAIDWKE